MTKGCYTCRRRRIICDNGQPTCRKCQDAGKECLGYQKPLVWVKGGVASRGKMMGRSFDEPKKPSGGGKCQGKGAATSISAKARPVQRAEEPEPSHSGLNFSMPASSSETDSSPSSGAQHSPETDWIQEVLDAGNMEPVNFGPSFGFVEEEVDMDTSDRPDERSTAMVHAPQATPIEYMPTPWGLVDPLLKDFNQTSRLYLHHYHEYMTNDFLIYPQLKNPWRDIISLVGHSPLLGNALLAMGALHFSLISNSDSSIMPWSSQNPLTTNTPLAQQDIENMIVSTSSQQLTSKSYRHYLEFKQRTLNQLSKDLLNPVMAKDDITLAAIVVLALLDLFESGSGAWSYHIEGAKKLLRSRPENTLGSGILQGLEAVAIDACLIMEIMGSTLARPGALSQPFYPQTMGPAMLKRLEETSWVGCPAYLLEVIFFVHTLWYPDSDLAAAAPQPTTLGISMQQGQPLSRESYMQLLQGIRSFDPVAWAQEMQTYFHLDDLSSRIALASAYQAGVYLYTSRVLSKARDGYSPSWNDTNLPSDHSQAAHDLITRICSVPISDPHFKCLIWPTFIAGAECRRLSQRSLILEKLAALYQAVTSINVRNAAWVLRLMWQKQDLKRHERENVPVGLVDGLLPSGVLEQDDHGDETFDSSFDWVDELDASRLDWLFI
ncbi:Protein of unknown function DUF3468 [Penicillium angulare]|uniref:Protein of unknown function DUF3468 n=1 Tax=Penicillium angulare TaxID=116970 RepID=UPI00253FF407|nr:Protein of unknown function DUF3468 [Penicillium angulare]KAJ5267004.1 Protein of unknown function DUF3468 [Penicillium angulare]